MQADSQAFSANIAKKMAAMTTPSPRPSVTKSGPSIHTPALARLRKLQINQLPCSKQLSTSMSAQRRGRTLERKAQFQATSPYRKSLSAQTTQPRVVGLALYPPYISVPGIRLSHARHTNQVRMVEGATCRLILQLLAEGKSWTAVIDHLHRTCLDPDQRLALKCGDILAIATACRALGLTAHTSLESEDWNLEAMEKWWIKEDRKRYDSPVREDICGTIGWWTKVSTCPPASAAYH